MNPDLLKRIEALEQWKEQKERQQVVYPLDDESLSTLNKYFLRIIDEYVYFAGVGDNAFLNYVAIQDGKMVDLAPLFLRYRAEPSTDFITIIDQISYNRFADDMTLVLYTSDTAPGGLSAQGLTTYYVVNATDDGFHFQVSLTLGGSAVNITSTGTGKQILQKL